MSGNCFLCLMCLTFVWLNKTILLLIYPVIQRVLLHMKCLVQQSLCTSFPLPKNFKTLLLFLIPLISFLCLGVMCTCIDMYVCPGGGSPGQAIAEGTGGRSRLTQICMQRTSWCSGVPAALPSPKSGSGQHVVQLSLIQVIYPIRLCVLASCCASWCS